jgi:hypothetical protein
MAFPSFFGKCFSQPRCIYIENKWVTAARNVQLVCSALEGSPGIRLSRVVPGVLGLFEKKWQLKPHLLFARPPLRQGR